MWLSLNSTHVLYLHINKIKIYINLNADILYPLSSASSLSHKHTRTCFRYSRPQWPVIDLTNVLWSGALTIYTHLVSCGNLQAFPFNSPSPHQSSLKSEAAIILNKKINTQKASITSIIMCIILYHQYHIWYNQADIFKGGSTRTTILQCSC